jgi:hypothetical protein
MKYIRRSEIQILKSFEEGHKQIRECTYIVTNLAP